MRENRLMPMFFLFLGIMTGLLLFGSKVNPPVEGAKDPSRLVALSNR